MHFHDLSLDQTFERECLLRSSHNSQRDPTVQQRRHTPTAAQEFQKIEEKYPILASNGCSPRFCQSGRMIHTDEPRVGKDRSIYQIEAEAIDFLRQMRRDNLFPNDPAYQARLKEVITEINQDVETTHPATKDATPKPANGDLANAPSSRGWTHTTQELEYGVRIAWKHSRKCIMRSQYENLRLCDLRHIKTSVEMGQALLENLKEAFNHGDIQPTVFVFPARQAGKSGPMIWNQQLFAFAGYTNKDGSVLGDPSNAELTTNIIELGWAPPTFRTKWDLLPLVTMAEGEDPVITNISKDDFPLVRISHPRYELPFEKLGLRWVPAPALSQLGFDIGGVQYTAAPFIGWFMDAEIGVRDLADESRYNVLPAVVSALYPNELRRPLGQLPEHERLALLSRAQAELNFAVYCSFSQNGIQMSDTLTASSSYCQFDDEHFQRHGFRLPADPYWLAPPQGSIVSIWHRGGAPHYQPKPMICRHREDPIKAWRRRQNSCRRTSSNSNGKSREQKLAANGSYTTEPRIQLMVYYCSSGTTAAKLANAIYNVLREHCCRNQETRKLLQPQSLDSLNLSKLSPHDILIIVASSTGRGVVPPNGQRIAGCLHKTRLPAARFAVFGNGDSSYPDTFNSAARTLHDLFRDAGLRRLGDGYIEGDNAKESPPWKALDAWLRLLPSQIFRPNAKIDGSRSQTIGEARRTEGFRSILNAYTQLELVSRPDNRQNIKQLTLRSTDHFYMPMDYLQVLAPNGKGLVNQVLRHLGKKGYEKIQSLDNISYFDFLKDFVELDEPFKDTAWMEQFKYHDRLHTTTMTKLSVVDALSALPSMWRGKVNIDHVLVSMPPTTPRMFSIASIPDNSRTADGEYTLDLLVQGKRDGKLSDRYLNFARPGDRLRCKVQPATKLRGLCEEGSGPIVAFVTGSGFAPMQSLLRFRAQKVREAHSRGMSHALENQISLFVGFRGGDTALIHEGLREALTLNLLDILCLLPSSKCKNRVQDKVFLPGIRERVEAKIRNNAIVFICANPAAADDTAVNLDSIMGCNVRAELGERYIEDRFTPL